MFYPEIVTGTLILIAGFLVKRFPNLIAGYNSLSKEQKKRVDIDGLSTFMKHNLIILGLGIIVIGFVLNQMGLNQTYVLIITSAIMFLDIVYLTLQSGKFYKKR